MSASVIPRRFYENLEIRIPGPNIYAPAYYQQVDPSLAYERRFGKHWSIEAVYAYRLRIFEEFNFRNKSVHSLGLTGVHSIGKRA